MKQIKTGDLIAVKRQDSWFWRAIAKMTDSPYTHVAIAIRIEGQIFAAETNPGGAALVLLASYENPYDVFSCPANRDIVKSTIFTVMRQHIHYGWRDFGRLALESIIKLKFPGNSEGMICSEFVANIYQKAGAKTFVNFTLPTPGQVVQLFNTNDKVGAFNANNNQS